VSVQLQALADEVFDAEAAIDLVVPSDLRTIAAPGDTLVAMVQAFSASPSPPGAGQGDGFSLFPARDEQRWLAFKELICADSEEQGRTEQALAELIALYRWRATNTPQHFYLAYHGERAVAHIGLFQHRTTAYLHALFTHPDSRRRGAGSFLTRAMGAEARALGCERVALLCPRDSGLPTYFERFGFRVVGER
jgi:GNAT superfamily N-acetyltransferase